MFFQSTYLIFIAAISHLLVFNYIKRKDYNLLKALLYTRIRKDSPRNIYVYTVSKLISISRC